MLKKFWPAILLVFILFLLGIGYSQKNNLNRLISNEMQRQNLSDITLAAEEQIQKEYNYLKNKKNYDFTLLEFGSTGCIPCKQMEPVLEEIRHSSKAKINVIFLHIMKSENLDLMKYYGISAVPMQILLDKEGHEFFRHYGFISTEELLAKFILKD